MNCCTDCDFKSQISTNVRNHIESRHVTSLGYTCPLCSKFCSSKNAWHLHKSRYHKGVWLQVLRNCFEQRSLRMQTEWTAALIVISSLRLRPMWGIMLRHIMWVLVWSLHLAHDGAREVVLVWQDLNVQRRDDGRVLALLDNVDRHCEHKHVFIIYKLVTFIFSQLYLP